MRLVKPVRATGQSWQAYARVLEQIIDDLKVDNDARCEALAAELKKAEAANDRMRAHLRVIKDIDDPYTARWYAHGALKATV